MKIVAIIRLTSIDDSAVGNCARCDQQESQLVSSPDVKLSNEAILKFLHGCSVCLSVFLEGAWAVEYDTWTLFIAAYCSEDPVKQPICFCSRAAPQMPQDGGNWV